MPPKLRKFILLIHLFGGLIAAVTLTLLGVSGGLLVFENEINHMLNGKLTWVQPGGAPLSYSELSHRLEEKHPGTQVSNIIPSGDDKVAYRFGLRATEKGGKSLSLAVNQYTGEELGSTGTANTFTQKLHQFHTNLLLGPKGKQITLWSAIILIVMALSGIILWWPLKLWKFSDSIASGRANFELHNIAGFYASIFMLIFGATGVVVHWDDETRVLINRLANASDAPIPDDSETTKGPQLDADQLAAIATTSAPGARVTSLLGLGGNKPLRITMKYPEDGTPSGRTNLYIEQVSGKVLYLQNSRTAPLGTRVAKIWNREIHTGDIYGLPSRIIACIASLSLPLLAITGPLIWWNRKRRKARA